MVKYSKGVLQLALHAGVCVTFTSIRNHLDSKYGKCHSKVVKRKRKNVSDIMKEMGPKWTRKAYRMHGECIARIHRMIWLQDRVKWRK